MYRVQHLIVNPERSLEKNMFHLNGYVCVCVCVLYQYSFKSNFGKTDKLFYSCLYICNRHFTVHIAIFTGYTFINNT